MCHFITLIIPSVAAPALPAILRARGRVARELHNRSLSPALQSDDRQFLTSKTCDCGTALAPAVGTSKPMDPERYAAKLRKQGWSEAKITRNLRDRSSSRSHKKSESPDSIEMWAEVVAEIFAKTGCERVSMFLHFYSGDVEIEPLEPKRRLALEGLPLTESLKTLDEDEVVTFRPQDKHNVHS